MNFILLKSPTWARWLKCCHIFKVYHKQSQLGGPEFCSRLPTYDAGGHEVALWGARHWCPFLHQYPRRGAIPCLQRRPLSSSAGTSDHKPAYEVCSQLSVHPSLLNYPLLEEVITPLIVCFCLLQEYVRSYVRHAGPSPVSCFLQFCWHWPVFEKGGHHGLCDPLQPHRPGTKIRPATRWDLHTHSHTVTSLYFLP